VSHPLTPLRARLTEVFAGSTPVTVDDPSLARAAVAVLLVPDPDAILLIRRAERAGDPWSGQMGLPGGRSSSGDADLLETAIRETREEVGIDVMPSELVGALHDVAPRSPHLPPLMVRPFVFCLPNRPPVVPNVEVAEHFWVELTALMHPGVYRPVTIQFGSVARDFPAYHVSPVPVWGMTERILAPLVAMLRQD
jgi:8-oxo-dGTP pyrophosphatase MutT (NUDIX family)